MGIVSASLWAGGCENCSQQIQNRPTRRNIQTLWNANPSDPIIATDKKGLEESVHTILNRLEKTRFEAQAATMEDLFPFLVIPAVMLVALEALVRVLLIRRFP